jgi:Heterokaryon incompatibility protein (HET)
MKRNREISGGAFGASDQTTKSLRRSEVEQLFDAITTDNLVYQPLPAPDSIRLLSLQAYDDDMPRAVHCNLSTHTFSPTAHQISPYKALSYVWGDVRNLQPIQVDSVQVMVRSNLYHALLELSKDFLRPHLWVDALCIDQANLDERNSQVALMKDIYTNATEVILWLGNGESDDSDTNLSSGFTKTRLVRSEDYIDSGEEVLTDRAHRYIACNEWFERCWTLQELILARAIMVRCGSHEITWKRLCTLMAQAFNREADRKMDGSDGPRTVNWSILLSATKVLELEGLATKFNNSQLTLSLLLNESWRKSTSEPVDKVFAIMGLFPEPPVAIDYSQTPEKVCKAATLACIVREKNLNILGLACSKTLDSEAHLSDYTTDVLGEQLPEQSQSPSWAVSLPSKVDPDLICVFALEEYPEPFQCISEEVLERIRSEPNVTVLPLTGIVLGRLSSVQTVEAMPPCTLTTIAQPQSATETTASPMHEASYSFSTLFQVLQKHDMGSCGCSEADRRSVPGQVEFNTSVAGSRAGDWLCLIYGGRAAYVLRPEVICQNYHPIVGAMSSTIGQAVVKLVGVVEIQYDGILQKIMDIQQRQVAKAADENDLSVWPLLGTNIPLA